MAQASQEEVAAVAAFFKPLQRALRDLAAIVGLSRRDLPLAKPALTLFGLACFKAGQEYERAKTTPQERPTVRRPPGRRAAPSGVVATPVVEPGWPEQGEETPLDENEPRFRSQAGIDLTDLETQPGYPGSKRKRP